MTAPTRASIQVSIFRVILPVRGRAGLLWPRPRYRCSL